MLYPVNNIGYISLCEIFSLLCCIHDAYLTYVTSYSMSDYHDVDHLLCSLSLSFSFLSKPKVAELVLHP